MDRLNAAWQRICALEDILPETGVCALVGGRPIAVFRLADDRLFALDNHDPASGANVLSRGIVGDLRGEAVVASPIYQHHYVLHSGRCLEDPAITLHTYAVQARDGAVWLLG
jgi:nitrite reductase (NADH) small subunit